MDTDTKEYRRFKLYMVVGAVLSVILVLIFSYVITLITARMTYDATLDVKKTMLKENVENTIAYIDVCVDGYLKEHPDASDEELENEVTKIAHDKIYSETHMDGTYMWVQKVLNYDGGDRYAIRLIHPNLSDTEGDYLSTETINPSGIKAYEEELEGVKKNGSVYLTYDFKKLNSEEVTRKATYSSLYKRFDWIVCMGVNIDDLDHYQEKVMDQMLLPRTLVLAVSSVVWLVLLYMMFHIYRRTKGRMFEKKNKELSDQLAWDAVSGANSRVRGQRLMEEALSAVNQGTENILIAMLDVDFFKQFNDTYGHEVGDKVLRLFVDAVRKNTSEKDAVIRWGGDEFIAVFYDVLPEAQPELGDKILASIRDISLPELKEHSVGASIGFTYFRGADQDEKEALSRADEAVYEAKEDGRNNWKII